MKRANSRGALALNTETNLSVASSLENNHSLPSLKTIAAYTEFRKMVNQIASKRMRLTDDLKKCFMPGYVELW